MTDYGYPSPPEYPDYRGTCIECARFTACPCGCGWGWCENDPGELFDGSPTITCYDGMKGDD